LTRTLETVQTLATSAYLRTVKSTRFNSISGRDVALMIRWDTDSSTGHSHHIHCQSFGRGLLVEPTPPIPIPIPAMTSGAAGTQHHHASDKQRRHRGNAGPHTDRIISMDPSAVGIDVVF